MCSCADADLYNPQIFMEHLCPRHCAREGDRCDPCPHAVFDLGAEEEIDMQADK